MPARLAVKKLMNLNEGKFGSEDLDKPFYSPIAKRFVDGAADAFTGGKPYTTAQETCMKQMFEHWEAKIVHVTENHNHAAVQVDYHFQDFDFRTAQKGVVPALLFFDFDHNCQVSREDVYLNEQEADFVLYADNLENCFDDDDDNDVRENLS